jgi:dolichyl-diphosphooligosaccharide--protein glycosyltransferase
LILVCSVYIRVDDLSIIRSRPDRFSYAGVPILPAMDGYYYLGLSRDLLDGNYDPIDDRRAAPQGMPRPKPVPLLVYLTYLAARATSYRLEWIAMIMPAALGVFLAFPVYGLGRCYGGTVMGLSAALVALGSRYYLRRSSVGGYDTDTLNVALGMALSFFFLRFAWTEGRRRYRCLLGATVTLGVFLWWWHTAPSVVLIFAGVPLAAALLFYYRPSRTEKRIFYGTLGILALAAAAWKGRWFAVSLKGLFAVSFEADTTAFPVAPGAPRNSSARHSSRSSIGRSAACTASSPQGRAYACSFGGSGSAFCSSRCPSGSASCHSGRSGS